jgi:hypothetical protein
MTSVFLSMLFYTVLGPPIGALIFVATIVFAYFFVGKGSLSDLYDIPMLLLIGIPWSFLIGGVQASFVGAIVGFFSLRFNKEKVVVRLAASLCACFCSLLFLFFSPWSHGYNPPKTFEDAIEPSLFFLSFHMMPAYSVWLIQHSLLRKKMA